MAKPYPKAERTMTAAWERWVNGPGSPIPPDGSARTSEFIAALRRAFIAGWRSRAMMGPGENRHVPAAVKRQRKPT